MIWGTTITNPCDPQQPITKNEGTLKNTPQNIYGLHPSESRWRTPQKGGLVFGAMMNQYMGVASHRSFLGGILDPSRNEGRKTCGVFPHGMFRMIRVFFVH